MVRRGFTLIEIMIVVAIIALLMTLTISVVGRVGHASKVRTCKAMMKDLERAAHSYKSVFGSYPRDYLENFSYLSSDSGSQEEQIRYKSTCVLVLALTHSHVDSPATSAACPCRGKGPFFEDIRIGDNAMVLDGTEIPEIPEDVSNPYSFSYLTFAGMGLSGGAGRPAIQLIDPWGNFIVYDEKAAYVNQQKGGPSLNDVYEDTDYVGVTFTSGGTWDSDPAYKLPFMIFSYGANGTDDTSDASTADSIEHGDDIGNW